MERGFAFVLELHSRYRDVNNVTAPFNYCYVFPQRAVSYRTVDSSKTCMKVHSAVCWSLKNLNLIWLNGGEINKIPPPQKNDYFKRNVTGDKYRTSNEVYYLAGDLKYMLIN